ncbi:MAG: aminotransferase class I/II-fold pyridoxal phosphate-dependent enzyme [Cyclobacteriaceae bacterium]
MSRSKSTTKEVNCGSQIDIQVESNPASLSTRGQKAAQTVLRSDFQVYFEALQNLYHPTENPDGTFPLNVAENKLSSTLLKEKLEQLTRDNEIPAWVAGYTNSNGAPPFREALAKFMGRHLTKCPIDPEHLATSAGATAIIEMTSQILCDTGDVAVFPVPSYPVYKQDIGNKSGVERYDLITHTSTDDLRSGPPLTIDMIDAARKDIETQGKRFRMLVLTCPDNPTGVVYTPTQQHSIADYCTDHKIHLVVNEIYGLSLINTNDPAIIRDYVDQPVYTSFAKVMQDKKSDYLHLWYALSKDFGASGFRVGVVYSLNEAFLTGYNNFNAPHMVSNHTQWLFQMVFEDNDFLKEYIKTNQQRLTKSYVAFTSMLKSNNIPYVSAAGSLFIWADFARLLPEISQEAEDALWLDIYQKTGILLTPGIGFGHEAKGQFRIVYSCFPLEELKVAIERMDTYLKAKTT